MRQFKIIVQRLTKMFFSVLFVLLGIYTPVSAEVVPIYLNITGTFASGTPVTVSVTATSTAREEIYYKFYYCPNYGTAEYATSPWVVMQEYSTESTCEYTFPGDGNYIVVVRTVADPTNEPENFPIIGGVVSIGATTNPNVIELSTDGVGPVAPDSEVTYTIDASSSDDADLYYKWFYQAVSDTDTEDESPWVVVQDYSTSNTCEYTFPEEGKYVVVVRAVSDPDNEPEDFPIVGGILTCKKAEWDIVAQVNMDGAFSTIADATITTNGTTFYAWISTTIIAGWPENHILSIEGTVEGNTYTFSNQIAEIDVQGTQETLTLAGEFEIIDDSLTGSVTIDMQRGGSSYVYNGTATVTGTRNDQ